MLSLKYHAPSSPGSCAAMPASSLDQATAPHTASDSSNAHDSRGRSASRAVSPGERGTGCERCGVIGLSGSGGSQGTSTCASCGLASGHGGPSRFGSGSRSSKGLRLRSSRLKLACSACLRNAVSRPSRRSY